MIVPEGYRVCFQNSLGQSTRWHVAGEDVSWQLGTNHWTPRWEAYSHEFGRWFSAARPPTNPWAPEESWIVEALDARTG